MVFVVLVGREFRYSPYWLVALTAAILGAGLWAAGRAELFFGRTDPQEVVIDEVAGQMITFWARPQASLKWLLVGFILFRFFDVVKPFPARRAERLPRGWGIMMDDLVAGAYSLLAITILRYFLKQ